LLDQWLTTVVKGRVTTRTFKDYEALLKLYIRPALGGTLERYSHVLPSIQDEAAAKVERLLIA
jgi:hypothetical protein